MLTPQTVAIDFEGFRFFNQPFIVEEFSVRSFDYNDTTFLKPFPIHLVSVKAQKSNTCITNNIHGLNLDSGITIIVYCFFLSLKIRFSNIIVYAKGNEKGKVFFLRNFFTWVIDSDHPTVLKRPNSRRTVVPIVSIAQHFSHEIIAHGRNQTCFIIG